MKQPLKSPCIPRGIHTDSVMSMFSQSNRTRIDGNQQPASEFVCASRGTSSLAAVLRIICQIRCLHNQKGATHICTISSAMQFSTILGHKLASIHRRVGGCSMAQPVRIVGTTPPHASSSSLIGASIMNSSHSFSRPPLKAAITKISL